MSKSIGHILIVDDDDIICLSLKMFLEQHVEHVKTLNSPTRIPASLSKETFDVVLLDMNFRQGDTSCTEGLFWLRKIKSDYPETQVILMTAYGDIQIAVDAIKDGATDFVVKPWQNEKLLTTVKTALQLSREKRNVKQLKNQQKLISATLDHQFDDFIGISEATQTIRNTIQKVATTDADVLLLGANGTGKEVVARAIHRSSNRKDGVFLSVDVGALSEQIFESELFGHKKGAFTDAREDRIGRFEAASGGTLFLDEIGNLPLNLQSKLLTVIQRRKIIRLGSNEEIPIDVRIICATNSDLKKRVDEGSFRQDLLYRINTVEIHIPPLTDRLEDIPLLVQHFLIKFGNKYQKPDLKIHKETLAMLQQYHWPGNVRELQHAVERAVIMAENNNLTMGDFSVARQDDAGINFERLNLEELEAWAIRKAISKHQGNISYAAQELGLSRGALYRRMEKYGI